MDEAGIPFLSATELSRLIERREVSPVEATAAYLERIDDLDFKFNAYLTVCRDQALQDAREAERAISQGNYIGPMHGVPVAVKDQFWSKGIRSTGGSRILADFIPDEDATVVANLKKAGAILLGKTNVTELAISGFTHRFSTPRNPWNLDMYAGGSSGGSGAGTAAFLCATSLGEDTGGSIRFPATWCGLVGHRPSWGLVSRYGVMRGVWSMDTVGPISRTVEDAAITLGAIAGHDPKDPYTWDIPVPDYRSALDGNINGMRIGVITEQLNSDLVETEVREVFVKAITVLGEIGASVEEISIPLAPYSSVMSAVLLGVEPAGTYRDWIRDRLQDFGHDNRINLLAGSIMPAQAYHKVQKLRELTRREVLGALEKYDVLILPTSKSCAPLVGQDAVITSKEMARDLPPVMTRPFNLASAPAISINCGFNSEGLPIGLQIGGRPFDESTVLRVAHAYEQHTPWHTMRPPHA
jgi:aspartyl-tRNA(Asn)/glutamyl-tRNA(Gln) amidotransferase subunit A